MRFINAHTYFPAPAIPLGTYVVNFSSNQYFAQNSLSGASVDLTWNMAGNAELADGVHLRYDPTYKTYLSVEQHFVGDHEYAIFSVNPATRAEKWWNSLLYDKLGSRFQIQTFTQYYTQQNYLQEPLGGAADDVPQRDLRLSALIRAKPPSQLTNYNVSGARVGSKTGPRSAATSPIRRRCR